MIYSAIIVPIRPLPKNLVIILASIITRYTKPGISTRCQVHRVLYPCRYTVNNPRIRQSGLYPHLHHAHARHNGYHQGNCYKHHMATMRKIPRRIPGNHHNPGKFRQTHAPCLITRLRLLEYTHSYQHTFTLKHGGKLRMHAPFIPSQLEFFLDDRIA